MTIAFSGPAASWTAPTVWVVRSRRCGVRNSRTPDAQMIVPGAAPGLLGHRLRVLLVEERPNEETTV